MGSSRSIAGPDFSTGFQLLGETPQLPHGDFSVPQ
jgi:hypothetical protein